MRATRISGSDPKPLAAPKDWKPEESGHCGALFVRREVHEGVHYMRSAWEVETNEAGLLLAGAKMTLGIAGNRHPVVQLGVADLPPDFDPVVYARRFTHEDGRPCVRVEMLFPHESGKRSTVDVHVDGTLADAVSIGISKIEELARDKGWVE